MGKQRHYTRSMTVRLPFPTAMQLDALAVRRHTNRSNLVRDALDTYARREMQREVEREKMAQGLDVRRTMDEIFNSLLSEGVRKHEQTSEIE